MSIQKMSILVVALVLAIVISLCNSHPEDTGELPRQRRQYYGFPGANGGMSATGAQASASAMSSSGSAGGGGPYGLGGMGMSNSFSQAASSSNAGSMTGGAYPVPAYG